jgi:hypothetical protein
LSNVTLSLSNVTLSLPKGNYLVNKLTMLGGYY